MRGYAGRLIADANAARCPPIGCKQALICKERLSWAARSAFVRSGEQMILAPECNGADRSLDWVGVELDATVVQESREAMPARQCITDRFGELAAARRVGELLFQPELQIVDERFGERPPFGHSMRRGLTANALLDGIELANSPQ